jgi:hypothetical protein
MTAVDDDAGNRTEEEAAEHSNLQRGSDKHLYSG